MPTHTATQLAHDLKRIITFNARAGFVVQTILMTIEFNKVIPKLPQVQHQIMLHKCNVGYESSRNDFGPTLLPFHLNPSQIS